MTKTIAQLTAATLPLDPGSLVEISIPGGGSRKVALGSMGPAINGSQDITTGAAPVIADNTVSVTRITTSGTAGNEDVYLPQFAATDPDGYTVVKRNGMVHTFVLDTQTDGSDVVRVYQADAAGANPSSFDAKDALGNTIGSMAYAVLNYQGATISFVWWDYNWFFINTQKNNGSEYTSHIHYIDAGDIGNLPSGTSPDASVLLWVVQGGVAKRMTLGDLMSYAGVNGYAGADLSAGGGTNPGDQGNNVDVNAGNGNDTGKGGDIFLSAGNSGSGTTGDGGKTALASGDARSTDGNGGEIWLAPGAGSGTGHNGHIRVIGGFEDFADDTAASAGGVPLNGLYMTSGVVKVRVA